MSKGIIFVRGSAFCVVFNRQKRKVRKKLKVYHGSTFVVKSPSLEILNYRTDFGKGFYTTIDINQAKRWTKIKKSRMEVEKLKNKLKRYINIYEYTENEKLNVLSI